MKLATPLTFADTGRTRFAHVVLDANGRIVPLADLVADHARLTADLELCQQAREALLVKDTLLATCACAIDGPDDICMHHSPKLSKAVADLADAVAAAKKVLDTLMTVHVDAEPCCAGCDDEECGYHKQGTDVLNVAGVKSIAALRALVARVEARA